MTDTCVFSNWDHLTTKDVLFKDTGLNFRIAPPAEALDMFKDVDPNNSTGFQNTNEDFYGHESLEEMEMKSGIEGLASLIRAESLNTAKMFANNLKTTDPRRMFNGVKRGISGFATPTDSTGVISIHTSDYFTAIAMNKVYTALLDSSKISIQGIKEDMVNAHQGGKYAFLFNGMGANISVLSRDVHGKQHYLLGSRPDKITRHVTVNEGTDAREVDGSSLHDLYARGMKEELGIHDEIAPASIREVFLVSSIGQFGIHMLAETDLSVNEITKSQKNAQDNWENPLLTPISMENPEELLSYTEADKPMISWTRDLITNLVKGPTRITP